MAVHELAELIDDGDGVQVGFALRVAPGKEAMSAEYDAVAARVFLNGVLEHHGEFEARALPGKPY